MDKIYGRNKGYAITIHFYFEAVLSNKKQKPATGKTKEDDLPDRRGRPGRLRTEESSRITKRITRLSISIGIILIIAKLLVYRASESVGILSSLVHSSLDFTAALSSFIAVRYAAIKPDSKYRFGRGKAEGFSAIFQVCLIALAGIHLLEAAVLKVEHPHRIEASSYAIGVMILAIALTIWLIIAQSWAIRATGSLAVRGDRAHFLADMLANIAVIIGILLTNYTSFIRADAIVGIVIALWLLYTGFKLARMSWRQLMDMELADDERKLIINLAMQDKRINKIHNLRTRAAGPHVHIQMQIDLDDDLSLHNAHEVVLGVEERIMEYYPAADILIHPHPSNCKNLHGNAIFHLHNKY